MRSEDEKRGQGAKGGRCEGPVICDSRERYAGLSSLSLLRGEINPSYNCIYEYVCAGCAIWRDERKWQVQKKCNVVRYDMNSHDE
jgi:hypothetical protein